MNVWILDGCPQGLIPHYQSCPRQEVKKYGTVGLSVELYNMPQNFLLQHIPSSTQPQLAMGCPGGILPLHFRIAHAHMPSDCLRDSHASASGEPRVKKRGLGDATKARECLQQPVSEAKVGWENVRQFNESFRESLQKAFALHTLTQSRRYNIFWNSLDFQDNKKCIWRCYHNPRIEWPQACQVDQVLNKRRLSGMTGMTRPQMQWSWNIYGRFWCWIMTLTNLNKKFIADVANIWKQFSLERQLLLRFRAPIKTECLTRVEVTMSLSYLPWTGYNLIATKRGVNAAQRVVSRVWDGAQVGAQVSPLSMHFLWMACLYFHCHTCLNPQLSLLEFPVAGWFRRNIWARCTERSAAHTDTWRQ